MVLPPLPVTLQDVIAAASDACLLGPLTLDELTALVNDDLEDRLDEPLDADTLEIIFEDEPGFFQLLDGRYVEQFALWDNVVFTHRLTDEEIRSGIVDVGVDFLELASLTHERSLFLDVESDAPIEGTLGWNAASSVEFRTSRLGNFYGEPGWLSSFSPGDLVGVRVGKLTDRWIGSVSDSDIDTELALELTEAFREAASEVEENPVEFSEIIFTGVAEVLAEFMSDEAVVFPPFADVLARADLDLYDTDWVAPTGFDFDAWEAARTNRRNVNRTGVSIETHDEVDQLVAALQGQLEDELESETKLDSEANRRAVSRFGDKAFRERFVAKAFESGPSIQTPADTYLEELFSGGQPRHKAYLAITRALMARAFDPTMTEPNTANFISDQLRSARLADQRCLDAVEELVWESLRRNELSETRRWIREWGLAGGIDVAAVQRGEPVSLLAHLLMDIDACIGKATVARAAHVTGRNDPCHCGSGRKFKQCCINVPAAVITTARGPLIHASLGWYVYRTRPKRIVDLASRSGGDVPSFESLIIAIDAHMCEPEIVNGFLTEMTTAISGPDQTMIKKWSSIGIGLWEVESTRPGHSITIRNIRDGATHSIRSDHMSVALKAGMYVATRPIPMDVGSDGVVSAQSEWRIFSGCSEVSMQHRERLLAFLDLNPSPISVIDWLALQALRQADSPQMRNTDNEEFTYATRRWVLTDAVAANAFAKLDALVLEDDDDDDADDKTDGQNADDLNNMLVLGAASALPIPPSRLTLLRKAKVDPFGWGVIDRRPSNRLLVGQVQLSEHDLELTANSLTRLDVISDWLRESLGNIGFGMTQTETMNERAFAEDLGLRSADEDFFADDSTSLLANMSDHDREAIQRRIEKQWLSESIPALGGLTPRQAAVDPTRLGDLKRLLNSFASRDVEGFITYDVNRLRRELGLAKGLTLP